MARDLRFFGVDWEAGQALFLPLSLTGVGLMWIGWTLWREPAVDAPRRRRSIAGA